MQTLKDIVDGLRIIIGYPLYGAAILILPKSEVEDIVMRHAKIQADLDKR